MSLAGRQRHDAEIAQTAMKSLVALIAKADPECGERLVLALRDAVWSHECEIKMAHEFCEQLGKALGRRVGT